MIDLLPRLKSVRACRRDRWTARRPAHDDHDPSLSIAHRDGPWLVKCFAGCPVEAIASDIGLTVADLFDDAPPTRWLTTPTALTSRGGRRLAVNTASAATASTKVVTVLPVRLIGEVSVDVAPVPRCRPGNACRFRSGNGPCGSG
jgi:hypothetical protein